MDPVLVIGDVHGHLDRLEALLKQEGIIARCLRCDGSGDNEDESDFCPACDGDGITRTLKPATVIQLGDLGHFGEGGSPTGDYLCYLNGEKWLDLILWGNHDRAVIEPYHAFTGFKIEDDRNLEYFLRAMTRMALKGQLKLAHSSHGYLFTHAGLHYAWKNQNDIEFAKNDPVAVADWINQKDWFPAGDNELDGVRDAIGHKRFGRAPAGGILWRDIKEKLYDGFPQIFGHSGDPEGQVRYCIRNRYTRKPGTLSTKEKKQPLSYGLDVHGNSLVGLWLPEMKVVRVDL